MQPNLLSALAIFTGAGCGGLLRFGLANAITRSMGLAFPYGTLGVNILGGLVLGLLVGFWSTHDAPATTRLFLTTGLLGGFTTFSAFTLETVTLFERHQAGLAITYIVASVAGAVLSLMLGMAIARYWAV